ncbi:MAG: outer membrane lipoprotein-sorting protein [Spirochaetales bacterium]|nr:outer membrane lipoprotein-sorting protein [Spirochaetales bacterium]
MKRVFFLLLLCLLFFYLPLFSQPDDAAAILDTASKKLVFGQDVSMKITLRYEESVVGEYILFRRDKSSTALLLQQKPGSMNGTGYLFLSGTLWLYNPVCRCFESSYKSRRAAGNFLMFADILPFTLKKEDTAEKAREKEIFGEKTHVLECYAAEDMYSVRMYLSKKTGLPVYREYLNDQGNVTSSSTLLMYGEYGKQYIPIHFLVQTADGRKVEITCSDISIHPLPDAVFTKSYLLEITR